MNKYDKKFMKAFAKKRKEIFMEQMMKDFGEFLVEKHKPKRKFITIKRRLR